MRGIAARHAAELSLQTQPSGDPTLLIGAVLAIRIAERPPVSYHQIVRRYVMGTLIRNRPFLPMQSLRREMDEFFGDLMSRWEGEEGERPVALWRPGMDVAENDTEFVVRTDLPGVEKKDIEISVDDHQLIVSGERTEERKVKEEHYLRVERSTGQFYRSFMLPKAVREDDIRADLKGGVLTIHIPKAEVRKPRKIAVA
jgi:HSP20 family protein